MYQKGLISDSRGGRGPVSLAPQSRLDFHPLCPYSGATEGGALTRNMTCLEQLLLGQLSKLGPCVLHSRLLTLGAGCGCSVVLSIVI